MMYQNAYGMNPLYQNYQQYVPQYNNYNNRYVPQQMPTQSQEQQQYDSPIQDVKFVTADEAKAYIVMPNTKVMLMDRDKSIFYIKSADTLGKSTLEGFKYTKLENNTDNTVKAEFDAKDFAKKDDLSVFVTKDDLKTLTNMIEDLQKQVKINKILEGDK